MFLGDTDLASENSYNCLNADGSGAAAKYDDPLLVTPDFQCSSKNITATTNDIIFVTGDDTIWATTHLENMELQREVSNENRNTIV
jgi:hypothetical protein